MAIPKLSVEDRYREIKASLTAAFRALRKQNLIARQNHWCCSSCGSHSCATDAEKCIAKGKDIKGWVFYHRQDEDSFQAGGDLHIRYAGITEADKATIGTPEHTGLGGGDEETVEVGKLVVAALEAEGLTVEWDGDSNVCIKVVFLPEIEEVKAEVLTEIESGKRYRRSRYNGFAIIAALDALRDEGKIKLEYVGDYIDGEYITDRYVLADQAA